MKLLVIEGLQTKIEGNTLTVTGKQGSNRYTEVQQKNKR